MINDTSIQDYISLNDWTYIEIKKREWKIHIAIKRMIKLWEKWQEWKHYS